MLAEPRVRIKTLRGGIPQRGLYCQFRYRLTDVPAMLRHPQCRISFVWLRSFLEAGSGMENPVEGVEKLAADGLLLQFPKQRTTHFLWISFK